MRSKRRRARVMPGASSPAAAWLGARWPRSPRLPKPLRVGTLARKSRSRSGGRVLRRSCVSQAGGRARLMGLAPDSRSRRRARSTKRSPSRTAAARRTNAVQRAEYADLKVYMPNDPLVKVDRMSMAHGLEVRCPLLDRRVVELAFRIPASTEAARHAGQGAAARAGASRGCRESCGSFPSAGSRCRSASWLAGPHAAQFRDEVLGSTHGPGAAD